MTDFLQTDDGDLNIVGNTLVKVEGADEVRQRLTQRLRTFLGEWFLDKSVGLPYMTQILVKNPNGRLVEALIKREIVNTPGVIKLLSFDFDVNKSTRKGTIKFQVQSTSGPVEVEVIL